MPSPNRLRTWRQRVADAKTRMSFLWAVDSQQVSKAAKILTKIEKL